MLFSVENLLGRLQGRVRRTAAHAMARREVRIALPRPIISFSFDDFPRNAATIGGPILQENGTVGTYYVSLGLTGTVAATGEIIAEHELAPLAAAGHELGCHTFDHHHAWETDTPAFASSLRRNAERMRALLPHVRLETMSYPISEPSPGNKKAAGGLFAGCRAGGQASNRSVADLNCLKSFFLEQTRGQLAPVLAAIAQNRRARGWLIFSTHDIAETPSPYGCTPAFFRAVLEAAVKSEATLLPVGAALRQITGTKAAAA